MDFFVGKSVYNMEVNIAYSSLFYERLSYLLYIYYRNTI